MHKAEFTTCLKQPEYVHKHRLRDEDTKGLWWNFFEGLVLAILTGIPFAIAAGLLIGGVFND